MTSSKKIGDYIRKQRKNQNLTQKQLANKLNVSFQAVSKWETGETYPDVSSLLQLSEILNTTTDKILSGGQVILGNQKFIDVNNIIEGFNALEALKHYFGKDSSFYKGAIDGINNLMNIDFEQYLSDKRYREVMYSEAIIQYLMNGYTMNLEDIKQHITSKKMLGIIAKYMGETNSIKRIKYEDNPSLFNQIRSIKPEFNNIMHLNQLPGAYIKMDPNKTYFGIQIETGNDWCYGIAVDDLNIYVFTYDAYGKNQTLIHEEKIKK